MKLEESKNLVNNASDFDIDKYDHRELSIVTTNICEDFYGKCTHSEKSCTDHFILLTGELVKFIENEVKSGEAKDAVAVKRLKELRNAKESFLSKNKIQHEFDKNAWYQSHSVYIDLGRSGYPKPGVIGPQY